MVRVHDVDPFASEVCDGAGAARPDNGCGRHFAEVDGLDAALGERRIGDVAGGAECGDTHVEPFGICVLDDRIDEVVAVDEIGQVQDADPSRGSRRRPSPTRDIGGRPYAG